MNDVVSLLPETAFDAFASGREYRADKLFGAHPFASDDTRFAVWAPNAQSVSVVGDFNGWRQDAHPMSANARGVWQCHLPGLASGATYKYAVTDRRGRTVLKTDPFAGRMEKRPNNASIVTPQSEYVWEDGAYLRTRKDVDWQSAPMSVYELHLGSWRRRDDGEFCT